MKSRSYRIILLLIGAFLFTPCSFAQATRSEYDIFLGGDGYIISGSGDGYGGGWYYYPDSGVYRQWFYNDPYDLNRTAALDIWVYIEVINPNKLVNVHVSCGWATSAWQDEGINAPPLPSDVAGAGQEALYIKEKSIYSASNIIILETSSIEPHTQTQVSTYNPQWICITVRGDNVHIYRWISHECLDAEQAGACCHPVTGNCFISTSQNCPSTREWLGPGTTCNDCQPSGQQLDYGDAPQEYPVLRIHDGARHILGADVYLGNSVTAENDGQPDISAASDEDDGVQFFSTLIPGHNAAIKVNASTHGILNMWLDMNQDNDWKDPAEHVLIDEPLVPGDNTLQIEIPSTSYPGESFMRFRFSTTAGLDDTGQAPDGEVEDYMVTIADPAVSLAPQSPATMLTPLYKQRLAPSDDPNQLFLAGWPALSDYTTGPIVADDFIIISQAKIVGLRWWGAFEGWTQPRLPDVLPSAFHIGIWSHDMQTNGPGTLLWEQMASTWTYAFSGLQQGSGIQGLEPACFEFVQMFSQPQWFDPNMDNIPQYWLSIAAEYDGREPAYPWGWSTRPDGIWLPPKQIVPGYSDWPPIIGSSHIDSQPLPLLVPGNWSLSFELFGLEPDPEGGQEMFLFINSED